MTTISLNSLMPVLSFGKLSNLAIMGEGSGVVPETSYPRVIAAVNAARTALYTRFRLKDKELQLIATEGRTDYFIRPEYAFNSGVISVEKYLIDDPTDPFLGGLARIEAVYSPHGIAMQMNNLTDECNSIYFPSVDSVRLVDPKQDDLYRIIYRYAPTHLELDLDMVAHGDDDLGIPDVYREAFLSYIAAQVYGAINGQENTAKSQEHMVMYEAECARLTINNVDLSNQSNANTRFSANGWV